MNDRPVFISVLYRSGSTLLVLALDQSDELKMAYDSTHFMRFSYGLFNPIRDNLSQLLADTSARTKERLDRELDIDGITQRIYKHENITEAVVYNEIMHSFLQLNEGQRWGDRTAVKWTGILPFIEMFPKGKVIHIYRDPRAVLASYKRYTYHEPPQYIDAIFASLSMFNFIEQQEILNNENIFLLKYEDLVQKPEENLRNVCEFLEIEFVDRMLDAGSFKEATGEVFDSNSSFISNRKSIDTSTMNLWKEKLTTTDIYLSELVLKDKLVRYGYELTGVDLSKAQHDDLYDLLHNNEFISKRYKYWLKYGNGLEAYPDTPGAYETGNTNQVG